ncbi:MAG: LysR family transcriptional regulator [Myxococcales bacterium]|nr:LysR family transcriptional regulator [Myxococcales bacterium]
MASDDDKLDANLVLALHALLEERSVTRAAARQGVGQPAMSHALKRLRERFDDPLLVRGDGRRLQLTPRALELADLARQGVEAVARVFEAPATFDPTTADRRFVLATSDAMSVMLVPPLLDLLQREAPGVDLELRPIGPDVEVALDEGRLDLALGRFDHARLGLRRRRLYRETLVCAIRADHPEVGASLELATYTALGHLLVAPRGSREGVVDVALAQRGARRRVAVVLPTFVAAALIVARSDLVLTLPCRVARWLREQVAIRVLPAPLPLPEYEVLQLWHERDQHDPSHRWLRGAITRALEAAGPSESPG